MSATFSKHGLADPGDSAKLKLKLLHVNFTNAVSEEIAWLLDEGVIVSCDRLSGADGLGGLRKSKALASSSINSVNRTKIDTLISALSCKPNQQGLLMTVSKGGQGILVRSNKMVIVKGIIKQNVTLSSTFYVFASITRLSVDIHIDVTQLGKNSVRASIKAPEINVLFNFRCMCQPEPTGKAGVTLIERCESAGRLHHDDSLGGGGRKQGADNRLKTPN